MPVDSAARNPEFQRLTRLQTEAFARNTPYHSLELNDGAVIPGLISVEQLRTRLNRYPLPEDLRGKRVLDIGAASGWNSFECERRGAEVVAIDCVEYEELLTVKRLRESKIEYAIVDMDELTPARFGHFDYVLFFGVFYHLRHPLLGLENVCSVTRGVAFIESYVIDDAPEPARCFMEFYETDELGGQIDNWCGPTTQCLLAMTRAAGFPRAEFLYTDTRRGGLIASRRWPAAMAVKTSPPPFLCSAVNNRHGDAVFQPRKDEYMCLSFFCDDPLTKADVFVEIDEYGVPPVFLAKHEAGHWQVNVKVPPGTDAGTHNVRLGTTLGGFSDTVRIKMLAEGSDRSASGADFIAQREELPAPVIVRIENTMDHSLQFRGFRNESLECRFTHSDEQLDLSTVQLTVDGQPWPLLLVERPAAGLWQVKARMRGLDTGTHELRLRTARSAFSLPITIQSESL